jgi:RND family efflux transporter MFP subunit
VVLGALVVIAAIVWGVVPRLAREKALAAASQAADEKIPVVNVVEVRRSPAKSEMELPGDLQAQIETPIFARTEGYIRKRLVDIGAHVRAGELMAELDTPELDQQLSQARANLAQAQASVRQYQAQLTQSRANLNLAKLTVDRWKRLADSGVLSRQEYDEKQAIFEVRQAEVEAAQANINAAQKTTEANEANLKRLEELKRFSRITAPFDGLVTYRNPDVGTLINAGSGTDKEMFRVAQIDPVRIFVNVPQTYAGLIQRGQPAELRVQELPGRVFRMSVSGSTHSVDTGSRTMLTVLRTPNPQGVLLPGMYAQVKFVFPRNASALLVPADALMMGREGTRVAVVGPDRIVHLRRIHISRDYGPELEVDSGVAVGETVIVNPNDQVRENARVEPRTGR